MTNQEAIEELKPRLNFVVKRGYTKESEDYITSLRMAIKALEENEKLKDECQKAYYQMMKVENYVQADITRLNEQLQHVRKVADVIKRKNKMIMNGNQMSAVEVLEWLNKNIINVTVMLQVFDSGWVSFNDILGRYEAQEIVDKITEYEKSNKFFNFDSPQVKKSIEKYVPDTNVGEFNVGDWVKCTSVTNGKVFYGTITNCYEKSADIDFGKGKAGCFFYGEMEHAEPPKEEQEGI